MGIFFNKRKICILPAMLSQHFQIQFAGSLSSLSRGVRFHFLHLSLQQPSLMHQSWLMRWRLHSVHLSKSSSSSAESLLCGFCSMLFLHVMTLRGSHISLTQSSCLLQKLPSSTAGSVNISYAGELDKRPLNFLVYHPLKVFFDKLQ